MENREECVLCDIVSGRVPSNKVCETDEFLVVHDKYPSAPVHLLVIDKKHREKKDTLSGFYEGSGYWDRFFKAIYKAIKETKLDISGYKLVNNGAGYNHFEHEHFHILGGSRKEPKNT